MNSWAEISDQYEKTPEMVAFREWCFENGFEAGGHPISFTKSSIKTIFGFLQCFAETKGTQFTIGGIASTLTTMLILNKNGAVEEYYGHLSKNHEEAMLWCAIQYFERIANAKG